MIYLVSFFIAEIFLWIIWSWNSIKLIFIASTAMNFMICFKSEKLYFYYRNIFIAIEEHWKFNFVNCAVKFSFSDESLLKDKIDKRITFKWNLICLLTSSFDLTIPNGSNTYITHEQSLTKNQAEKNLLAKTSDKLMIDAERCLQVESELLWSSIRTSLAQQGALKSVFTCQNYVAFLEK